MNDAYFIENIRSGGRNREEAVSKLINQYSGFVSTISQKVGISLDLATDAFTDAIMVLVDHIVREVYRADAKISTYLYKVCYHKSVDLARYHAIRETPPAEDLPDIRDHSQDLMRMLEIKEDSHQIKEAMALLGDPCHQILMDWSFWGFSMHEIATRAGLKDSQQAKKQKYRCLQRLMRYLAPQLHKA
ncbi:MAG: sigma-70 family RNA polymerase sigma factor [Bacteroidota bacterium]